MAEYIDRQAAVDALWKALWKYEDDSERAFQTHEELDIGDWFQHRIFVQRMSDIDRKTIIDMPSADVEPVRHGRWNCSDDIYEYAVCSSCKWDSGEPYGYITQEYSYCPNCGARMDKEGSE